MITDLLAFKKSKLLREINEAQENSKDLLNKQDNQQEVAHLMYEWQAYKLFYVNNPDITKIPLEELKEKHKQVMNLLEQVKSL
ncbi:hypothetical protein IEQ_04817 [Bacillus cereus BAG6X1-2]|nr:hypothetical protein IEQ_04817 [Bacillus cereus BAG6X1-2]